MPRTARKALRTLVADPVEFRDVVLARVDGYLDAREPGPPEREEPLPYTEALEHLDARLGGEAKRLIGDPELAAIGRECGERAAAVAQSQEAFPSSFNASAELARLCYVLCRVLQPAFVVETGVAYGATSAHILQALELNGRGELHSIDWTLPASTAAHVGAAIPERLRDRWKLWHGPSRRLLPRVVRDAEPVGMFVADAVHSFRAVKRELETVAPYLDRRATVLADDVEGHAGFSQWARAARPAWAATVRAKASNAFGVALVDGRDQPA